MTDALPRDGAAVATASAYRLQVLGTTELTGGDGADAVLAQPKRLALLVYLAVARPRGFHRRDRLVTLFWPEHDQEHARAALRKAVHAIRKSLGNDLLVSRGDEEVAIDHTRLWCDAVAFDDALKHGRIALALELFRGDLLDGFFADAPGFERWLEAEREVYRESAVDAAWTLAQRYEAGAELTEATRWARRVARLTTTNERVLRRVIQLLDRVGDRAGAIRVYEEFATRVRTLFDVEPSAETQALIRRIKGA
jgi:DNA-binding SARP family transcriptional activator